MTLDDATFTKPRDAEEPVLFQSGVVPAPAPDDEEAPPIAVAIATRTVVDRVLRLAVSELPVLFTGEDGAGKRTFATCLHAQSRGAGNPLVRVSCLATNEAQLERELFGIESGPDAGPGALESADGGTILIEHVNALPASFEPRLLHVLEYGKVYRAGSVTPRAARVRFLATALRRPEGRTLVRRLAGAVVEVPPIRERMADVEPLARKFLLHARANRAPGLDFTPEALEALRGYEWPGNVGEIRLAVERAVATQSDGRIHARDLDLPVKSAFVTGALHDDVERLERQRIESALAASKGNRSRAARALGIARNTLLARLKAYGL